ncbi:MAG: DUF2341 domain-containing protein [Candidatus Omnitrophota bacterium]|nr:DUF2341 domain-containing protein [Candidatus Omnitrophota bacterium]
MKTNLIAKRAFSGFVVTCFMLFSSLYIWAAYSQWTDSNWAPTSTYVYKTAAINTSGPGLKIDPEVVPVTDSAASDFLKGTKGPNVMIAGSPDASLELAPTVDPFPATLGQWGELPSIPAPGVYTRYMRMGDYIYCIFASGDGRQFGRIKISDMSDPAKFPKWEFLEPLPVGVSAGTAVTNDGEYIYVLRGSGSKEVYFYLPPEITDPDPGDTKFPFLSPGPGEWKKFGTDTIRLTQAANVGADIAHTGSPLSTKNGYLYVLSGGDSSIYSRYDPNGILSNLWGGRAGLTGILVNSGASLSVKPGDNYIYASIPNTNNIRKYTITDNVWATNMPPLPVDTAGHSPSFTRGARIYYPGSGEYLYACGISETYVGPYYTTKTNRGFYRFGPITGTPAWTRLDDLPAQLSEYGFVIYDPDIGTASEGTRLHLVSGKNYTRPWEYSVTNSKWNTLSQAPLRKNGMALISPGPGSDYLYYVPADTTNNFFRYTISRNRWEELKSLPDNIGSAGNRITYLNGYVYCLQGNNNSGFWRYDVSQAPGADSWDISLPPFPLTAGGGSGIVGVRSGGNDYIYALRASGTNTFYRYGVTSQAWEPMANALNVFSGNGMVYPGYQESDGYTYIYASSDGGSGNFYRYGPIEEDVDGNGDGVIGQWQARAPTLFGNGAGFMGIGAHLYYVGEGKIRASLKSGTSQNLVYYIDTNIWELKEPLPFYDGISALTSDETSIYALYGYSDGGFARFDLAGQSWNEPVVSRHGSIAGNAVSDKDKNIYFAYGYTWYNTGMDAWHIWVYSPSLRRWTGLMRCPFWIAKGTKAAYLQGKNALFITKGSGSTKLYKYDVSSGQWSDCNPGDRFYANTQVCAGYTENGTMEAVYAVGGPSGNTLYMYSPDADSWTSLITGLQVSTKQSNVMAYVNGKIYVIALGTGDLYAFDGTSWEPKGKIGGANPVSTDEGCALFNKSGSNYLYCIPSSPSDLFLRYDTTAQTWSQLKSLPAIPSPLQQFTSIAATSIVDTGEDWLYAYNATWGENFIRYHTVKDTWDTSKFLPSAPRSGSAMCGYNGYIYYISGDASGTFYRYDIAGDAWDSLSSSPQIFSNSGVSMAVSTYSGERAIYVTGGENQTGFYRYDIPANTWTTLSSPGTFGAGNALTAVGGYIYALKGGGTVLWKYNIATGTWDATAYTVPSVGSGGSIVYPGSGDWAYILLGNNTPTLYKYHCTAGNSVKIRDCPVNVREAQSKMVYPGFGNYMYYLQGISFSTTDDSSVFLRYSMTADSWEELIPTSFTSKTPAALACADGTNFYIFQSPYSRLSSYKAFSIGEYVSDMKEVGNHDGWGNVSWDANGLQMMDIRARSGNDANLNDAVEWRLAPSIQNPVDLDALSSMRVADRYFQYRVVLATDKLSETPQLQSINFDYERYGYTTQEIISRVFDSGRANNRIMSIKWSETLPVGTDIRFQMRTASTAAGLTDINTPPWLGPGGTQVFNYPFDSAVSYEKDDHIKLDETAGVARLYKDLEDHPYSHALTLYNKTATDLTNQIVSVHIPSSYEHFWQHIRPDGADVRFHDGASKISYLTSSFDFANKAAWFNIRATVPAGGSKTIYMVYGNGQPVSESDVSLRDYSSFTTHPTLRAWWDFEDDTHNTYADDTGSVDGVNNKLNFQPVPPTVSPERISTGIFGSKAVSLDGVRDYMVTDLSPNFTYTGGSKTLSFWIRPKPDPDGGRIISVVNPYNIIIMFENPNTGKLNIRVGNGDIDNVFSRSTSKALPFDNAWHHVALVLSPDKTVKVYMDGQVTDTWSQAVTSWSQFLPPINPNSTTKLTVGNVYPLDYGAGFPQYYYTGDIDFISVFETNFQEKEIKDLYVGADTKNRFGLVVKEESVNQPVPTGYPGAGNIFYYRVPIILDNSGKPAKPGLSLIDINLDGWSEYWTHTKGTRKDMMVTNSDGVTVLGANCDPENYNFEAKTAKVTIEIPALAADEIKTIYFYYGNSATLTTTIKNYSIGSPRNFTGKVIHPYTDVAANNFGAGNYYTDNPVVQPIYGVFYDSDDDINLFSEVANKPATTDIRYQISRDGYNWYWWDGSAWSKTDMGYSQTNNAAEINLHLAQFQTMQGFSSGELSYRAWLHSDDGSFTPSLDKVAVGLVTGETYYTDASGMEKINDLHSKYVGDDRYMQYKAILYSQGKTTPVLNSVTIDYIEPVIAVTSPALNEEWPIGSSQTIRWTAPGLEDTTGGVKIEYWSNKINNWETIAAAAENDGEYSWPVSDDPNLSSYVRVTSNDVGAISGTSGKFIIKGLIMTSPVGGEIWEAGTTTHNITWDSFGTGGLPENPLLRILYSIDSGATYPPSNLIASNQEDDGVLEWAIPPALQSDNVRVRIVLQQNEQVITESKTDFGVVPHPQITIESPAGGEKWIAGLSYEINWKTNTQQFAPIFILEYSVDGGVTWPYTVDPVAGAQYLIAEVNSGAMATPANPNNDLIGTYNWSVPNEVSSNVKVRVSEKTVPANRDTNIKVISPPSESFEIAEPSITVTAPNGGEVWVVGDSKMIEWQNQGIVGTSFSIKWSRDDFNSVENSGDVTPDVPSASGSFLWPIPSEVIPAGETEAMVKIRIVDNSKDTRYDDSQEAFKILANPKIKILWPDGGEALTAGVRYNITWETTGKLADDAKYDLYYSTTEVVNWQPLQGATQVGVNKTTHIGTFQDFFPLTVTNHGRIRVESHNKDASGNPLYVAESENAFTVSEPVIELTSPAGGESWFATGAYDITWNTIGDIKNDSVVIEYAIDNGAWQTVSPAPAPAEIAAKSYQWRVPNNIGSTFKIRITDNYWVGQGYNVTDTSTGNVISPTIMITQPTPDYYWVIGVQGTVSWTTTGGETGAIKKLRVRCIADASHTYIIGEVTDPAVIASNAGSLNWTVPADAPDSKGANKAIIEISDTDPDGVGVIKTGEFNIKAPSFLINEPSLRPSWKVGTPHTISWTDLGSIQYPVKVFCRTSGGATVYLGQVDNPGAAYSWNVFDNPGGTSIPIGTSYIILEDSHTPPIVTKWDDPILREGLFYVEAPRINVSTPSGVKWTETDTQTISWAAEGKMMGNIKVEWSKPVGGVEQIQSPPIASGLAADITEAQWVNIPPEAVGSQVRLIVTDVDSPWGVKGSSALFTVFAIPEFTFLKICDPATGEEVDKMRIGNTYKIKWDDNNGAFSNSLELDYFTQAEGWRDIAGASPIPNQKEFLWKVPDIGITPCANAQVKISDTTPWQSGNPNVTTLESTVLPLVRPVFENVIVAKNASSNVHEQYIAYGESPVIKWQSDGHINENAVRIRLITETQDITIGSNLADAGSHAGWIMPDIPVSSQAKILVEDVVADYGGIKVIDESAVFNIITKPELRLLSPDGAEDYVIDKDTIPITWESKGLTVDNVKIEMSANDFETAYTIVDSTPNDGSFNWYIMNDPNVPAGTHVKIRVSMVGREAGVRDESNNYFTIRSGFDISSPSKDMEEVWMTNEEKEIRWQTRGSIPKVSVFYSIDGGANFIRITGPEGIDNTGVFLWKVPNERTDQELPADPSKKVIIRIGEWVAADPYISDLIKNDSNTFEISWYTIKFYIIDKDTYDNLKSLTIECNADAAQNFPEWKVLDFSVNSPISHEFPYGTFLTTWNTKPTAQGVPDYFTRTVEVKADAATAAKGVIVDMENRISATIEWHVLLSTSYMAETDKMEMSTWLERRGRLVEPKFIDTNEDGVADTIVKDDFKGVTISVYDYDTDTLLKQFTAILPDDRGVYKFTWDNTGLQAGKTYFVKAAFIYGENTYTSGSSLEVTQAKKQLEAAQQLDTIESQTTVIQAQTTAIQTAVEQTLPQKITEATGAIEKKVDATKEELKKDTARIMTATEQTIPAQITEKVESVLRSEILNRESTVRLGQKLMVRYRTYAGLAPVMDVYNPYNLLVISQAPMVEVAGSPGIYEYEILMAYGWNVGDYTIVCSEPTKGTMDALLISVIRTDLEEVASQVATIMGTTTSLSNLKDVADTLNSQFSIIESALGKISTDLVDKVKEVASSANDIESVYSQLVNIGKELKTLGANQDVNLSKLLEVSKEKSQDIKYLKNKTQQLKAAMEINTKMVDNIAHKPVTQTWFEYK